MNVAWAARPCSAVIRTDRWCPIDETNRVSYLYGSHLNSAHRRVGADGLDQLRREAHRPPGGEGSLLQILPGRVQPVGPVVAAQVVPEVLCRVQLRALGRQQD